MVMLPWLRPRAKDTAFSLANFGADPLRKRRRFVLDPALHAGCGNGLEFFDGQLAVFKATVVRMLHLRLQLVMRTITPSRARCARAIVKPGGLKVNISPQTASESLVHRHR
jgi:hypothetical protein